MASHPLCPQLLVWRQLYARLEEAYSTAGIAGMPPPPPVFNMQGWAESTDEQKQHRWAATKVWAAENGFAYLIPELSPEEYYDGE